MAGLMTWFQVTCPKCTGALQVRLPEGVTSVQCSQCKAVFAVQVQPVALSSTAGSAPAAKRSRKRKKESGAAAAASAAHGGAAAGASQAPRALSAYNVFMKGEVAKVKQEHPSLAHRDAFKLAAERWQSSPMNPQNGGDRFPLKLDDGKGGEDAAVAGGAEEGAGEEEMGEDGEDDPAADDDDAAEPPQDAAASATGDAGGAGDTADAADAADDADADGLPAAGESEPVAA